MVQRIIVGFDGSPAAAVALKWAAAEAQLHEAELVAWTVKERPESEGPHQRSAVARDAGGYPVTVRHGHGDAATALIAACAPADLLVVGSHRRGALTGLILGSVSRRCVKHALCPVVVVHPQSRPSRSTGRVVVGVDMSGHSRTALHVAAEEARRRGGQLDVVHAVYWENSGYELIVPTAEQLVEWGRRLVDTELAKAGVAGNPVVVHGHAADVLVRASADADLLVLGRRGRGMLSEPRLGSVSAQCLHHAQCPVMITRPVGAAEQAPPRARSSTGG